MKDNQNFFEKDEELTAYLNELTRLREDGVSLIALLRQENTLLKRNKLISDEERQKRIEENNERLCKAKETAGKNKAEIDSLVKKALARSKLLSIEYSQRIATDQNELIDMLKSGYEKKIAGINEDSLARKKEIVSAYSGKTSAKDIADCKEELRVADYTRKSLLFDAKNRFNATMEKAKAVKEDAFIEYIQKNQEIRNGKTSIKEKAIFSFFHFLNTFQLSNFLLNKGLYLTILAFFIVCVIIAPLTGNGNLLSLPNIFTILELSSVRMFYALGIAGLILLAGTDLSVGRMVALGALLSGLILHPGRNIVSLFGMAPWDFSALPAGVRIILALFLSVFFCVAFSAFSGFFSARLKIHPFISTLATQLIIYGLLFVGTGGTPVGTIDSTIKELIGGRWTLGYFDGEVITFPKLIIPALIAIVAAWFIWNKTIFGKNMYAVGGNPEAANVSGINVFRVTMGVFIMAGVFYGIGSFFEIFKANANAGTGQGYELDAIAACVIGGISFSGGVGKISGAVAGVIIFTGLTYCRTFLGIDTNLQFIFKGVIIIAAVALDSIKNLQHK